MTRVPQELAIVGPQGPRTCRVRRQVDHAERPFGELDGPLVASDEVCGPCGPDDQLDVVESVRHKDLGPHVGFDAILQLERRLPVVECRRGRAEHGGRERGLDRRPVRLGRPVGRLPVPGRLSGHPADAIGRHRPGLEGRSDPAVQVPPLARRQVPDDRLCEQPVPEAIAGLVGDQHLAVDRLPDRGQVIALSSPKDRREHRFVERATQRPQPPAGRPRSRPAAPAPWRGASPKASPGASRSRSRPPRRAPR